ncbi:MAG: SURF1 family protein [Ideonella sp.]
MGQDYRPQSMNAHPKALSQPIRRSRARAVLVLLAALVCAALTFRLGIWQLDRAAQKQALQDELHERSALPPLLPAELAHSPAAAAAQYQRRITLRGVWIGAATVFLDNRQMDARPGFFVLTPMRLQSAADAGVASTPSGPLIWIQRGWVVRDNDVRTRLPDVPTPAGTVEVIGRVAPPPARLFELGADGGGPIRQNLDLAASARALAQPVLPMTVLETENPSSGPDGLVRHWAVPAADIQKHYGYAFQWFAICTVVIGLYAWFQILRPRRLAERETV